MRGRGIPGIVVRRRRAIAVAWLGAAALLLPLAAGVEERLEVAARIPGSESAAVEDALVRRFESPFARSVVLVLSGLPGPGAPAGREALREVVSALQGVPGVIRTFSFLDTSDPLFAGRSGTFVVVGVDPGGGSPEALVPRLRAAVEPVAVRVGREFPGAALRFTGEAALNVDLRRAGTAQVRAAERRALPATLALLLLAFGALAAAVLPAVAGGLAIGLTLGLVALLARVMPLSVTLESVVSMLGLGLGIDYALLTVSRFRESLAGGATPAAAAEEAARHAGRTVAVSGAAVAVGFLGMLRVPLGEIRSVAVGGLLVVGVSVLLSTTLLPGLLADLGPRIDFGRLRRPSAGSAEPWRRWASRIASRPALVLLVAGTPLVLLALPARRMKPELPGGDWLPAGVESTAAVHDLQAMGRGGVVQTIRVVLELPGETSALEAAGWEAARRLAASLAADPRVAEARSLRSFAGDRGDDLAFVAFFPAYLKRAFLSGEGDAALVEVVPREGVEPAELTRFVRELRGRDPSSLTGLPGSRLLVGGLPAFNADYEDAVAGSLGAVVSLVLGGTLVALLAGFRSLLVPLKAVALNLLSVAAACGALVLVFQEGHGARLLGLAGPTGGVFPAVPVLVFGIVFGLSMDYEVFLVARVAEARRAGRDETAALAEGLARTGGVITSAAAVMVAVFAAFTLGDFLLVKMLGFALAVAVLLDATVVRLAVGPALLRLAGRANWWPGDPGKAAATVPGAASPAGTGS